MRFVVDVQLPSGLAKWLRAQGRDASHVVDLLGATAKDEEIWNHLVTTGSVLLTKDQDVATRRAALRTGPTILCLRIGNGSKPELVAWLLPQWDRIEARIAAGEGVIEVV